LLLQRLLGAVEERGQAKIPASSAIQALGFELEACGLRSKDLTGAHRDCCPDGTGHFSDLP